MGTILIGGKRYELIIDHKNGWNPAAFRDRYSEVLERYDYIIGDWGYNQLRLKGFFRDNHPKGSKDSYFSGLVDYINEYCNFGCAYFVIQRQESGEAELDASDEPDLLLTPPASGEAGAEDGAAAVKLDENGDPIILREHIRKPHPARKEHNARPDRTHSEAGRDGAARSGKPYTQRTEGRSGGERRDAEEQYEGADRWGGSEDRSGGSDRRGGGQARIGGQQRVGSDRRGSDRSGEQLRGGGHPRGEGQQRGGGQQPRGEQQRGGGQQPRGEQQRSVGQSRGDGHQRSEQQLREPAELAAAEAAAGSDGLGRHRRNGRPRPGGMNDNP